MKAVKETKTDETKIDAWKELEELEENIAKKVNEDDAFWGTWATEKRDGTKRINAPRLAARIAVENEEKVWLDPARDRTIHVYNEKNGIWVTKKTTKFIESQILKELNGLQCPASTFSRAVKELYRFYAEKTENRANGAFPEPDQDKIVLKNGVYNFVTNEFTDYFDPRLYAVMNYPISFDKDAEYPLFTQFIKHLFGSEMVQYVLTWIAYLMMTNYRHQYILVIQGASGVGKSELLSVIELLLNKQMDNIDGSQSEKTAYSSVSLSSLANSADRFSLASLQGKTANLDGDVDSQFYKYTALLKTLSGGDAVAFEKKGVDKVTAHNTAKLVFVANKLPIFRDDLGALRRRFQLLRTRVKNRSENKAIFRDIARHIANNPAALAGIFNSAISAYTKTIQEAKAAEIDRLDQNLSASEYATLVEKIETAKNTDWILPEKILKDTAAWMDEMDPILEFLNNEDGIEQDDNADSFVYSLALYQLYAIYCDEHGSQKMGERNFAAVLEEKGFKKVQKQRFSTRKMCYENLKLNEDGLEKLGIQKPRGWALHGCVTKNRQPFE